MRNWRRPAFSTRCSHRSSSGVESERIQRNRPQNSVAAYDLEFRNRPLDGWQVRDQSEPSLDQDLALTGRGQVEIEEK